MIGLANRPAGGGSDLVVLQREASWCRSSLWGLLLMVDADSLQYNRIIIYSATGSPTESATDEIFKKREHYAPAPRSERWQVVTLFSAGHLVPT